MDNSNKRTGTGLSSALEGFAKPTPKPKPKPSQEDLASVGEGLGFRHTGQTPTSTPVKRARRPRVKKMQLNHSVSVNSVELFERVAEKSIDKKKGELLEMAIQLLADSQGIK